MFSLVAADYVAAQFCMSCLKEGHEGKLYPLSKLREKVVNLLKPHDWQEWWNPSSLFLCIWCYQRAKSATSFIENVKRTSFYLQKYKQEIITNKENNLPPKDKLYHDLEISKQLSPLSISNIKYVRADCDGVCTHSNSLSGVELMYSESEIKIEVDFNDDWIVESSSKSPIFMELEASKIEVEDINDPCIEAGLPSIAYQNNISRSKKDSSSKLIERRRDKSLKTGASIVATKKNENVINTVSITKREWEEELQLKAKSMSYIMNPFKCSKCVVGFNFLETYNTHMLKHDQSYGPYFCEICECYVPSERQIQAHKEHHLTKHICTACGAQYRIKSKAVNHYKYKHQNLLFTCEICKRKFGSEFALKKHRKTIHEGEQLSFQCSQCGKSLRNKGSLRNHMLTHEKTGPLLEKRFECDHCAAKFHAKGLLVKHMVKHRVDWSHHCTLCQTSFKSEAILQVHNQRKHSDPNTYKHQCEYCSKRFLIRGELTYHINWTHLHKGVKCLHCPKIFRNVSKRHQHIKLVHENMKPKRDKLCEVCGKGFTEEHRLKRHRMVHTGERPFKCQHCGVGFSQKSTLNNHVVVIHISPKVKPIKKFKQSKEKKSLIQHKIKPSSNQVKCKEVAAPSQSTEHENQKKSSLDKLQYIPSYKT